MPSIVGQALVRFVGAVVRVHGTDGHPAVVFHDLDANHTRITARALDGHDLGLAAADDLGVHRAVDPFDLQGRAGRERALPAKFLCGALTEAQTESTRIVRFDRAAEQNEREGDDAEGLDM